MGRPDASYMGSDESERQLNVCKENLKRAELQRIQLLRARVEGNSPHPRREYIKGGD